MSEKNKLFFQTEKDKLDVELMANIGTEIYKKIVVVQSVLTDYEKKYKDNPAEFSIASETALAQLFYGLCGNRCLMLLTKVMKNCIDIQAMNELGLMSDEAIKNFVDEKHKKQTYIG